MEDLETYKKDPRHRKDPPAPDSMGCFLQIRSLFRLSLLNNLENVDTIEISESLGGMAYDMDIHMVEAHGHRTPQAGGAELQGAIEAALILRLSGGHQRPRQP